MDNQPQYASVEIGEWLRIHSERTRMPQEFFELVAAVLAHERPVDEGKNRSELDEWNKGISDEWNTIRLAFEAKLLEKYPEFNPALFKRDCNAPY